MALDKTTQMNRDANGERIRPGENITGDYKKSWSTVPGFGGTFTTGSGATSASAAATVASPGAGNALLVDRVHASYDTSSSASGLLTLKNGANTIFQEFFVKALDLTFDPPILCSSASSFTASIPLCTGSAAYVNVMTRTIATATA